MYAIHTIDLHIAWCEFSTALAISSFIGIQPFSFAAPLNHVPRQIFRGSAVKHKRISINTNDLAASLELKTK